MRYTKLSMLQDLRKLGIQGFDWDEVPTRPDVRGRMAGLVKSGEDAGRAEVLEYCWTLYQGALNASGPQVGRTARALGQSAA